MVHSKSNRKKLQEMKSKDNVQSEAESQSEPTVGKQCNVCSEKFADKRDYDYHMVENHTAEFTSYCRLCFFRFSNDGELGCHIKTNHSSKPTRQAAVPLEYARFAVPSPARHSDAETSRKSSGAIPSKKSTCKSKETSKPSSSFTPQNTTKSINISEERRTKNFCYRCNVTYLDYEKWRRHVAYQHVLAKNPYPIVEMNYVDVKVVKKASSAGSETPIQTPSNDSDGKPNILKLSYCKTKGTYIIKTPIKTKPATVNSESSNVEVVETGSKEKSSSRNDSCGESGEKPKKSSTMTASGTDVTPKKQTGSGRVVFGEDSSETEKALDESSKSNMVIVQNDIIRKDRREEPNNKQSSLSQKSNDLMSSKSNTIVHGESHLTGIAKNLNDDLQKQRTERSCSQKDTDKIAERGNNTLKENTSLSNENVSGKSVTIESRPQVPKIPMPSLSPIISANKTLNQLLSSPSNFEEILIDNSVPQPETDPLEMDPIIGLPEPNVDESDFVCGVCQQSFTSHAEVEKHFTEEHFGIRDNILEPESPYPTTPLMEYDEESTSSFMGNENQRNVIRAPVANIPSSINPARQPIQMLQNQFQRFPNAIRPQSQNPNINLNYQNNSIQGQQARMPIPFNQQLAPHGSYPQSTVGYTMTTQAQPNLQNNPIIPGLIRPQMPGYPNVNTVRSDPRFQQLQQQLHQRQMSQGAPNQIQVAMLRSQLTTQQSLNQLNSNPDYQNRIRAIQQQQQQQQLRNQQIQRIMLQQRQRQQLNPPQGAPLLMQNLASSNRQQAPPAYQPPFESHLSISNVRGNAPAPLQGSHMQVKRTSSFDGSEQNAQSKSPRLEGQTHVNHGQILERRSSNSPNTSQLASAHGLRFGPGITVSVYSGEEGQGSPDHRTSPASPLPPASIVYRGVTLTPPLNNASLEQQKQLSPTASQLANLQSVIQRHERSSPTIRTISPSIIPPVLFSNANTVPNVQSPPTTTNAHQFAVPRAPSRIPAIQTADVNRPDRPPTVDLTEEIEGRNQLPNPLIQHPRPAVCTICNLVFSSSAQMEYHKREVHYLPISTYVNRNQIQASQNPIRPPSAQQANAGKQQQQPNLQQQFRPQGSPGQPPKQKYLYIPLLDMTKLTPSKMKALEDIGISNFVPLSGNERMSGHLGIPILALRNERQSSTGFWADNFIPCGPVQSPAEIVQAALSTPRSQ